VADWRKQHFFIEWACRRPPRQTAESLGKQGDYSGLTSSGGALHAACAQRGGPISEDVKSGSGTSARVGAPTTGIPSADNSLPITALELAEQFADIA
jgi:hypothetical protein